MTGSNGVELVVLLDEEGNATGTAPKAEVHHSHTPLHLAFSCYLFNDSGELLLTRRAATKPTFPGVWTNSFCGHPAPGEQIARAVQRRARQELGVGLTGLQLVLPRFRYDATMPNGVRENEMCPVFTARTSDRVAADPTEVDAVEWVPWDELREDVRTRRRTLSPWCMQQVVMLAAREEDVGRFRAADDDALPPAARGLPQDKG